LNDDQPFLSSPKRVRLLNPTNKKDQQKENKKIENKRKSQK
jgi:hypothetical protein